MARYQVNSRTFISGQLIEPGFIVTLPDSFPAGWHLTPLDDTAEAAYEKYLAKLPDSQRPQPEVPPVDVEIDDPGPDESSNEVDLSATLAGSVITQATPGPTEAKK